MLPNKKIQTTELDFDGIKNNLKEFLRGQDQFSDYDFEGSGLSILLDVLAYNTHYNALYTNLAVNEAFLDSASKRASVVSKAKELGYVPRSATTATAVVTVTFINNDINAPDFIQIPRSTLFRTKISDVNYNFYSTSSRIGYRQDNQYIIENVELKEGTLLENKFIVQAGTSRSFLIPNAGIDLSTLRVTVQENSLSSVSETFVRAETILEANSNSKVYFAKETDNGLYEIEFGNGVIGKALSPGNIVTVEYLVTSGSIANNARLFTYEGAISTNTESFVTTVDPSFGGSEAEGIDTIKWNAPRSFAAQNRCVTLDDYKSVVTSLYPNAESINVWGGETNDPPSYGDVFISIKPQDSDALSEAEKDFVLNDIIGKRKIVTLHPKLIDPEYINIQLDISFYYDKQSTTKSANDLTTLVYSSVNIYNNENLNRFDGVLKYSALSRAIDSTDPSIKSSITTVKLHREVQPVFNQLIEYNIATGNPIYNAGGAEESIISTGINVINIPSVCYIDDVSTLNNDRGTLRLFYYSGAEKIEVRSVGYVIYSKGLIVIENVIITGIPENTFKLIIKPQSNDVVSVRNQIVSIRPELLKITAIEETDANNYKFTSSRN